MSFFLFTTFIFVSPCCIICLLLFVWYFVFKLSFSYVFSLLFSGVFSNVIHYSITIVKEICCLWCHFVLHSQLTHFCLFKFSQLLSCGKERSVISCFQIKLFSSKLRLDFCRSLMSALPQCGLLSQTAAGNQANSKLKVLKWPQLFPVSCFWSRSFALDQKWNFTFLYVKTRGRKITNIFLLYLSVHRGDYIEQIKRICHIHFKANET